MTEVRWIEAASVHEDAIQPAFAEVRRGEVARQSGKYRIIACAVPEDTDFCMVYVDRQVALEIDWSADRGNEWLAVRMIVVC